MIDNHDIDMLAAEYVLGTLEPQERLNVEQRRATDVELDSAILRWQEDLVPLNDLVQPVAPDSGVQAKLDSRLDDFLASHQKPPQTVTLPDRYKTMANRWRLMALTSSFVAACLVLVLVYRPPVEQLAPRSTWLYFRRMTNNLHF